MDYYPHPLRISLERMPGLYLVPCNIHSWKLACWDNVRWWQQKETCYMNEVRFKLRAPCDEP